MCGKRRFAIEKNEREREKERKMHLAKAKGKACRGDEHWQSTCVSRAALLLKRARTNDGSSFAFLCVAEPGQSISSTA